MTCPTPRQARLTGAPATPEAPAPPLPLTALPSTELIPASATVTAPSAIPAAAAVSAAAHAHRGTASHHHLGAMRSLPAQPALREDPHGPHLRPFFPKLPTGAYEPFILDASGESREQSDDGPSRSTAAVQVPASINRYLRSYQREGIQFLYRLYKQRLGGLVCDDMGLGKTIQVIGFLAALFSKSGLAKDEVLRRDQVRRDKAVFPPVLVVCPTSVIFNWRNEFRTWGYFTVDVFHGTHIRRADVLKQAKQQHLEVVITSFATFRNQAKELQDVDWAMVIVDEVHQLKDPTSKITGAMKEFRAKCKFGLTGTAIQNRYSDLWCLLDWCNEGSVGTRAAFEREIAGPLRQGQSYSASNRDIARGREVAVRFRDAVLSRFLLRRTKKLIADQLPKKEDKVVFCPMTKRQETAYQNILHSPDFQLLARKDEPCDCAKARNDPRHKRGKCCYQTTSTGEPLQKLVLPALVTLQKVANHLALIMPGESPFLFLFVEHSGHKDKSDPKEKQQKDEKLVSIAFGAEARRFTYDYMNMRDANNCGKWKILDELLTLWHQHGSKVLIFSHSLKLLGMLEEMVRLRGYGFLRIDGSMTAAERADRVERFNADAAGGVFVFLISARAGGVGINLTAANVVVIFDPSWNPSHDLQAQDRAYRIGQARDVSVFRFIAAGSIEEIVYGRQLYKQQQANIGYNASEERRLFEGIEGDAKRKGELFGMENLLAYESRSEVITKLIIDKVDRAEADYVVRDLAHVEDEPDDDGDGDGDDGRGGNDDERSRVGTTAACKRRKRKDAKVAAMTADPDEDLPTLEMRFKPRPPARQKSSMQLERDRVAAILLGNDVEYTHANADVLGSSKIERQITENAKKVCFNPATVRSNPHLPTSLPD
ncbi:P-loop containing nucleoside triphosphate hydrolase protein [Zopfochytrium polystomum]|nr:P-loop containing nucleoside triphosphate hydrolase protein [Zopfochytrium polystomum]